MTSEMCKKLVNDLGEVADIRYIVLSNNSNISSNKNVFDCYSYTSLDYSQNFAYMICCYVKYLLTDAGR